MPEFLVTPFSNGPHVAPLEVFIRLLSALFPELAPGELLRGEFRHQVFRTGWSMARADSFQPTHDISTALAQEHAMAHPPRPATA